EGGLPGRWDQDEVRDRGDRGPREVGHRGAGGTVAARLAQRVDRVDGGAGVRQADRDVPGAAQRGRRDGHVRVGPGERGPADPLQLHLQVEGDETAGAHAVDVDPPGLGERLGDLDQDGDVQVA